MARIPQSDPRWLTYVDARIPITSHSSNVLTQFLPQAPQTWNNIGAYTDPACRTSNDWGIRQTDGSSWMERTTAPDGQQAYCLRVRAGQEPRRDPGSPGRLRAEWHCSYARPPMVAPGDRFWLVFDLFLLPDMFNHPAGVDPYGVSLFDFHGIDGGGAGFGTQLYTYPGQKLQFVTYADPVGARTKLRNDARNGVNATFTSETPDPETAKGDAVIYLLADPCPVNQWLTIIIHFDAFSNTTGARTECWRSFGGGPLVKVIDNTRRNTFGGSGDARRYQKFGVHKLDSNFGSGSQSRTVYTRGWYLINDGPGQTITPEVLYETVTDQTTSGGGGGGGGGTTGTVCTVSDALQSAAMTAANAESTAAAKKSAYLTAIRTQMSTGAKRQLYRDNVLVWETTISGNLTISGETITLPTATGVATTDAGDIDTGTWVHKVVHASDATLWFASTVSGPSGAGAIKLSGDIPASGTIDLLATTFNAPAF